MQRQNKCWRLFLFLHFFISEKMSCTNFLQRHAPVSEASRSVEGAGTLTEREGFRTPKFASLRAHHWQNNRTSGREKRGRDASMFTFLDVQECDYFAFPTLSARKGKRETRRCHKQSTTNQISCTSNISRLFMTPAEKHEFIQPTRSSRRARLLVVVVFRIPYQMRKTVYY